MISTLEQMRVPNGTGPGVRRSKRSLFANRTRCNILNLPGFGNKFTNWCNVVSIEGVTVYGHVPECHVTFRRGRLHNVHIHRALSWETYTQYISNRTSVEQSKYVRQRNFFPGIKYKILWQWRSHRCLRQILWLRIFYCQFSLVEWWCFKTRIRQYLHFVFRSSTVI